MNNHILLSRLKAEDNSSFRELYQYCFPVVSGYIVQNTGTIEDAEDIFQEAVIVLLQKIRQPDFVLSSSLKTYIYAVSKNLWLKRLRDNKTKNTDNYSYFMEDYMETNSTGSETEVPGEEKVRNWLRQITIHCQKILKALFFHKIPMDILMVKMGWKNKHTASNQKYKCIQQIKKVKEKKA
ncbi:RNA polymerase sigma factor [Elizabethkingia miricola]|nr:sigma-70 family RNA polymerase sigma factor [Elizabethkingia miricola]NHQ65232.1 sigma-70 family RNA polymerase sigma factor [Elizabethkingia miricola]NHQ72099.1 sigma-70 family RNA polymerase sigma factor [Elizabethkingia miricola]UIO97512.1 sigma-70 family RNA polymerase sigma factor [Elizabethkingia miricola]WER14290.1 sigma-70 family RNA polymerase sigma factor [Elizabethkingia miricola]WGL74463.1 sigma-70 family RNA polymerase sigma factor [Elizabethkingia miricola]